MATRRRYHQTRRDRRDESRGMRRSERSDVALHRVGDDIYAGKDGRTFLENQDYGMLHEDHTAIANMPQHVIMREYPKYHFSMDENINDDIRGIDVQQRDDGKRQKRGPFPEKY